MTDQTRYRIVCADGATRYPHITYDDQAHAEAMAALVDSYDYLDCGPHTVEPVEPVAPDPTTGEVS